MNLLRVWCRVAIGAFLVAMLLWAPGQTAPDRMMAFACGYCGTLIALLAAPDIRRSLVAAGCAIAFIVISLSHGLDRASTEALLLCVGGLITAIIPFLIADLRHSILSLGYIAGRDVRRLGKTRHYLHAAQRNAGWAAFARTSQVEIADFTEISDEPVSHGLD